MIRAMIDYFFEPIELNYDSNWSSSLYNRCWYILSVVMLLMIIATLVLIFMEAGKVVVFISAISIFALLVINLIQKAVAPLFYPEQSQILNDEGC